MGQCADVFADPLASPRPGFEPRPDAESVCGEVLQAAAQVDALGPGDLPFALPVDDYADAGQQLLLVAVQYDPVDEIEPLVHLFRGLGLRGPQVGDAARTRAELDLVFRDVDINQLALPAGQRGAGADEYVHLRLGVGCDRPQFFPVEKLLQP